MDQVLKILDQLGINQSFFLLGGFFVVSYFALRSLAINRVCQSLIERDKRMDGREKAAKKLQSELSLLQQNFDEEMKSAHKAAAEEYATLKKKAIDQQRGILQSAREKGAGEIKEVRDRVSAEIQTEYKKIESEIPGMAQAILNQILQNKKSSSASTANFQTEA